MDRTKQLSDTHFEAEPRIRTCFEKTDDNQELVKYFDKAKFLSKFSCFDGFMQYVDLPCREKRKSKGSFFDFVKDFFSEQF